MRLSAVLVDNLRRLLWSVGAMLFTVMLSSLVGIDGVPRSVPLALFFLTAIAGWVPAAGLAIVVTVVPVASWIGRTWVDAVAWPETVVIAFLAGYAMRRAITRGTPSIPVDPAVYSLIAVVVASFAVQMMALQAAVGIGAFKAQIWDGVVRDYFSGIGGVELDAAMRLIEGVLLLQA